MTSFIKRLEEKEDEMLSGLVSEIAMDAARTRRILELEGNAEKFDSLFIEKLNLWFSHYEKLNLEAIIEYETRR